jgi:putative heme iron utilization protein
MTSIDRYGFEMLAVTKQGDKKIRLAFKEEVSTPDDARMALVSLVKEARVMNN